MAIANVVARGFGSFSSGVQYLPTRGYGNYPTLPNAFLLGTVACSPRLAGVLFVGPALDGTITELPLDLIGRLALSPEIAGTLSGGTQIKGRLEVNRKTSL